MILGDRQTQLYRRMGPLSRPSIRSGQWSQTTIGSFHPAARLTTQEAEASGAVRLQGTSANRA